MNSKVSAILKLGLPAIILIILAAVLLWPEGKKETPVAQAPEPTPAPVATHALATPTPAPQATPRRTPRPPMATPRPEQPKEEHKGKILDRANTSPIEGARVTAYLLQKNLYTLQHGDYPPALGEETTDAAGEFNLPAPELGPEQVVGWRVEADGYDSRLVLYQTNDALNDPLATTVLLDGAGTIDGFVVNENDEPIANARVGELILSGYSSPQPGPGPFASEWKTTAEDGRFALQGIPLEKSFQIPVSAPGYLETRTRPIEAGTTGLKIVLRKSEVALTGVVLTDEGMTVPNARVTAQNVGRVSAGQQAVAMQATKSNESGEFAFPDLMAGSYLVTAAAASERTLALECEAWQEVVLLPDESKDVELRLPPTAKIVGRFVDEATGNGVGGVRLRADIERAEGPESLPSIVSASSGEFRFELCTNVEKGKEGNVRLRVELPEPWTLPNRSNTIFGDYNLTDQYLSIFGLKSGETKRIEVPLGQGRKITGVVYQPDGETPGADLSVFYEGRGLHGAVTTDGNGEFEFLAPLGAQVEVEASSDLGIATAIVPPGQTDPVKLILQGYASISGTVTTSGGEPVESVVVEVEHIDEVAPPDSAITFEEKGHVTADGTYKIEKVAAGRVRLTVNLMDERQLVEPEPQVLDVAVGEERTDVNFILKKGDFLDGLVLDMNDSPIAEASITAFGGPRGSYGATTNEDGEFTLEGIPIDQPLTRVTATHRDYEEETKVNVSIYDGKLIFHLKALGKLTIMAVDPNRQPIGNYRLLLQTEADSPVGTTMATVVQTVVTDSSGQYDIEDMPSGNFRAEVTELGDRPGAGRTGTEDFTFDPADGDKTVTVKLDAGMTLSGRVVRAGTESPMSGATVVLKNPPLSLQGSASGPSSQGYEVAASGGTFEIGPLPAGTYTLWAYTDDMVAPEVQATVSSGGENYVTLGLAPAPTVYGTVTDLDGNPARNGLLFFAHEGQPPTGDPVQVTDGTYEKTLTGAGSWEVHASLEDSPESVSRQFSVGEGQSVEVNIDFTGKVTLTGNVFLNGEEWTGRPSLMLRSDQGDVAYLEAPGAPGEYRAKILSGKLTLSMTDDMVSAPFDEQMTLSDSPARQEHDFLLWVAPLDILVVLGESPFQGGHLTVAKRGPNGEVAAVKSWAISDVSVRLFQVPEGDYQAILTRDGATIAQSGWVTVSAQQQNQLVIEPIE
ncbi:carboxypeptidase regulatory-like domain-containing protein [bacterium]|nr:carboxypeptidase regulatory-like domain-containing protein [bacterium]